MKRVLIIDDAAIIRSYHRQILESAGFAVDEALNGMEALEKCCGQNYALLLVDLNMPTMDGLSFLRLLRQDLALPQVPAVVISTELKPDSFGEFLSAGANFYLAKPLKPALLTALACFLTGTKYESTSTPVFA